MGVGPVPASRLALERAGLKVEDIDLWELNEAFAAQVLACIRELGIPHEKLNVNGGAIAHRPPAGRLGRAPDRHAGTRATPQRRALRRGHDVHRGRSGARDRDREPRGLTASAAAPSSRSSSPAVGLAAGRLAGVLVAAVGLAAGLLAGARVGAGVRVPVSSRPVRRVGVGVACRCRCSRCCCRCWCHCWPSCRVRAVSASGVRCRRHRRHRCRGPSCRRRRRRCPCRTSTARPAGASLPAWAAFAQSIGMNASSAQRSRHHADPPRT